MQSTDPVLQRSQAHSYAHSSHFGTHPQPQQQQQRPPIPPAHQPRLQHSVSVGNIAMSAAAPRPGPTTATATSASGSATTTTGAAAPAPVPPKKKDPYATAWRTYSKIAEELQLLNPDGTLYPISKEAILKYLHHQSKRIKSSNLHWYVNGLKKHQENLGFPWDEVRYDDQVVSLLKELTLHPVMIENGDEDSHGHGHANSYGSQPNRQRQTSGMSVYGGAKGGHSSAGTSGHHYASSSIDTARIANLSISQHSSHGSHAHGMPSSQQHQQHHPQHHHQSMHSSAYGGSSSKQQQHHQHPQHHHSQHYHHSHTQQQQQQHQHYLHQQPQAPSHRPHQPSARSHYHSMPIQMSSQHVRTNSAQELAHVYSGQNYGQGHGSEVESHYNFRLDSMGPSSVHGLTSKRKRPDFGVKKRRVPSSVSMEGEHEEDELQEDELKDDAGDEAIGRRGHDMEDFDDMEDSSRYQPLKRRASTGTLLNQVKASAVKHVPGGYEDPRMDHLYSKTGLGDAGHRSHGGHLRSPSPDLGDEGLSRYALVRREGVSRVRDSPPESVSSRSSVGEGGASHMGGHYHRSEGGLSSHHGGAPAPGGTGSGKTTVQFSEVVECAQQLQAKYGGRCKDHAWGCVQLSPEDHLELTIKMYLDWAGLVASGRLTMDELPDLAEFRRPEGHLGFGTRGGTLKRMSSTPLTSSLAALGGASSTSHRLGGVRAEDSALGPYRSPSSSPTHGPARVPEESGGESIQSRMVRPPASSLPPAPQRPIPPSPGGHALSTTISFSSTAISSQARRMSSSPSLHHAHLQHQVHVLPRGSRKGRPPGSMVSNSTASSPASEVDMSDDEADSERNPRESCPVEALSGRNDARYSLGSWSSRDKTDRSGLLSLAGAGQELQAAAEAAAAAATGRSALKVEEIEEVEMADDEAVVTTVQQVKPNPTIQMDVEDSMKEIGSIPDALENESSLHDPDRSKLQLQHTEACIKQESQGVGEHENREESRAKTAERVSEGGGAQSATPMEEEQGKRQSSGDHVHETRSGANKNPSSGSMRSKDLAGHFGKDQAAASPLRTTERDAVAGPFVDQEDSVMMETT